MFSCGSCSQSFTNKGSLKNHKILCDILSLSQREQKVRGEELDAMPCHEELVRITQKLALKYVDLERAIQKMERVTSAYTKCKIDGERWLNDNVAPDYTFVKLLESIELESSDISLIFDKKNMEIFTLLINRFVRKMESPLAMINNKLYVYKHVEKDKKCWVLIERMEVVTVMNTMLQRIMEVLTKWRCDNAGRIANNDTLSIEYNKVLIKLMNTDFNKDSIFNNIKNHIGNIVKYEVVNTIEYVVV